ncbi:M55 family metallopeptidase [Streptomyces albus subsp. chlorinus]|uniref:M55 family metallopeptidase n=1 Tax=Streptomyces albus TaxID=1888 RepID=UPI00156DFD94|nr:M55 family metallopeptidase [Streptomyces albus]NSC21970.1 M55 family metallopeptidase [Streptomyces albus subsp. chlorinus]
MKVYISADMEGVTGLVGADDVQMGGRDYERGRVMMTEDVNAAVRGALGGGAREIVVNDTHSTMRNLLVEDLHPAASLVRGKPKPMGMLQDLDASFDAVVCVGYHARAGRLGVLSHSFMGHEIEDMWLDDDRAMGEIGFAYATATALGVPVVALSGCDVACAEVAEWDSAVRTAPVKYARDRFTARLRPADEARSAIQEAAEAGVRDAASHPRAAPDTGDHTLAVRWQSASVAQQLEGVPGVSRTDDRTVRVRGELPALFRLFGVFMGVAYSLTGQPPYC